MSNSAFSKFVAIAFALITMIALARYSFAQESKHEGRDVYDAIWDSATLSHRNAMIVVSFTCEVDNVYDGDFVHCKGIKRNYRIAAIDAPEIRGQQPRAIQSRDALRNAILYKTVLLSFRGRDTVYGRRLVVVKDGDQDAGLEQIRNGEAWYFRQYAKSLTADEQKAYGEAEAEAKAAKRGLWAEGCAVPPWQWRRGKRCGR